MLIIMENLELLVLQIGCLITFSQVVLNIRNALGAL